MIMEYPISVRDLKESAPPVIWDNTMRQLLGSCPRKLCLFLRGYDWDIAGKPSYFTYGIAFGKAQQVWHELPEGTDPSIAKNLSMMAGLEEWDNAAPVEMGDNTRDKLVDLWVGYVEAYPWGSEPWRVVKGGSEIGWTLPMGRKEYSSQENGLGGGSDGYISRTVMVLSPTVVTR